jgi:protein involved in polysaccharide export with SLBB domain
VVTPGAYTFSAPPTPFELLRAAGGPGDNANLGAARVIGGAAGATRTINLSGFLTGENLPDDVLKAGDTLVVPSIADGSVGLPADRGVQVFGSVRTPTTVPLEAPLPLLTVLMLAGAPLAEAKLDEISWVHPANGEGNDARRIDLTEYLDGGQAAANPLVYPGDSIYLPQRQPSWLRENLPLLLSMLTAISTAVLVADNLQN